MKTALRAEHSLVGSDVRPLAVAAQHVCGCGRHDAVVAWGRHDLRRVDMAATFAQELDRTAAHGAAAMTPDVREVVAGYIAYAVCSQFGLELSLHSVDYVAGRGHPPGHDPETFRVGMAAVRDGAASLIDAIEAAIIGVGDLELAA